jgi:hypothetical protein
VLAHGLGSTRCPGAGAHRAHALRCPFRKRLHCGAFGQARADNPGRPGHGPRGGSPRSARRSLRRLRPRELGPHPGRARALRAVRHHPVRPESAVPEPVPRRHGRGLRDLPGRQEPGQGRPTRDPWREAEDAGFTPPPANPEGYFREWAALFQRADLSPSDVRLLEHMARKMLRAR